MVFQVVVGFVGFVVEVNVVDVVKLDLDCGKVIVGQVCVLCYGVDGNSVLGSFLKFVGQYFEYLVKQLNDFKMQLGVKGLVCNNVVMVGFVSVLSVDDMCNVVVYYGLQMMKFGIVCNVVIVLVGQKIYCGGIVEKGVLVCVSCYGLMGQGILVQYLCLLG